jgi:hypothetical protein
LLPCAALTYDRAVSARTVLAGCNRLTFTEGFSVRLRAFYSIVVVAVALSAHGCGDDDSGADCGAGTVLVAGECVPDADAMMPVAGSGGARAGAGGSKPPALTCGDGTIERDGECVAIDGGMNEPAPVKRPIGSACEAPTDCASGYCATTSTSPGGLCTVLNCSMDNACPVGSTCYRVTKGTNVCMPYCDTSAECRTADGYNCQPLYTNAINICAPSCTLTNSCPSGTNCNATTGLCELAGCDPAAAQSACADTQTCYPDTRGLTAEGGLCLRLCDPKDSKATCKVDEKDEVCQPLPDDPANTGFCAPPVCSKSGECPAGAVCQNAVCQPPALCDSDGACADDSTTCVSGKCMAKCPTASGTSCADIHPDLVCADVLTVPACLPLGTFPGSGCRQNTNDACSPLTVGTSSVPMVCENDTCLVDCGTGGTPLCAGIDANLECATGIFDTALCLPKGAFPGSACDSGGNCAQDLDGNPAVDMKCLGGTCVVDCDESSEWDGYGDALCALVDATLTCANSAGSFCTRACTAQGCSAGFSCMDPGRVTGHENACLPTGSFPGSPCRTTGATVCDEVGGVPQHCEDGTCVIECGAAGDAAADDALCAGFDPGLTCSETADDICVFACGAGGECPTTYSCFGQGAENACLPTGSFPGSPCRPDGDDPDDVGDCDADLDGVADADMVCVAGACVVECETGGNSAAEDAVCTGVSAALTCSETAGDLCVLACGANGVCPETYSCLGAGAENACLPTGSFPGSPCRPDGNDAGTEADCDQDLDGNADADMICANNVCVIDCATPGNPAADDDLCEEFGLTCAETASDVCVVPCAGDASCPQSFSCLDPGVGRQNACLPDGTFPGSTCRPTGTACDTISSIYPMRCLDELNVCALDCSAAVLFGQDPDLTCDGIGAGFGATLTCSESAGDICVVACGAGGSCAPGYSCLDPGEIFTAGHENACLPDGTFPFSKCRTSGTACDSVGALPMQCTVGLCAPTCPSGSDAICEAIDPSLTCSDAADGLCVPTCDSNGACDAGFSCLLPGVENECLPTGSFPGSPCRAAAPRCDSNVLNIEAADMICTTASGPGTCIMPCSDNDDALCGQLDPGLTCFNNPTPAAPDVCMLRCQGPSNNLCPPNYSCNTTFPGDGPLCFADP